MRLLPSISAGVGNSIISKIVGATSGRMPEIASLYKDGPWNLLEIK